MFIGRFVLFGVAGFRVSSGGLWFLLAGFGFRRAVCIFSFVGWNGPKSGALPITLGGLFFWRALYHFCRAIGLFCRAIGLFFELFLGQRSFLLLYRTCVGFL